MLPSIFSENLFDDLFDDAFDRNFFSGRNPLYGKHARNLMKTDVQESDTDYTLEIDLPGFTKDEVHVDLSNGYLTVSAEKGLDKDEENKKGQYIRRERYVGSCQRSFYVGDVRTEDVKCKYESGVLRVTVPKKDAKAIEAPSRIMIE